MNSQTHKTNDRTGIISHWLDLLEEHDVRFMVLDPQQDDQFIEQLQTRPDWIVEFVNQEVIFFVHDEATISH